MDKALERDAKLRYQSASEFGRELFEAIDDMPKGAAAGGEGGTLVIAPVPQTRVAASPDSGRAPAGLPPGAVAPPGSPPVRSRMPLYVGGGALAAAAVVAGVFLLRPVNATPPAANPSPIVTPNTAPPAPAIPTSAQGSAPAAPTGGRSDVRSAGSASAGERGGGVRMPAASKGTGEKAAAPAADVATRLPALLDQSDVESSAAAALAAADSLLPRATRTGDLVGLGLVRAKALGMLARDAESCAALRAIQGRADGTPYAGRIAQLLRDGC
jgi:hypothetical protein